MSMYLKFRIGKDKRKLVPINGFELKDADSNNPQWLQGRQNEDGGRQVFVDLEDENGSPINLTGASAVFKGVLPGGQYKIWDHKSSTIIDAQAGRFRYTFPKRAMAIAGSYKQAFFEIFREGTKLATLEFNFEVLADLVEENIIPSDYITPFEDLYGKLKEYLVKFNGDFDAAMTQWKKDVADLITELNADISGINLTITEIKNQLSALEDKIKADGLLTKADFDAQIAIVNKNIADALAKLQSPVPVDDSIIVGKKVSLSSRNSMNTIKSTIDANKFNLLFFTDPHYGMRSGVTNYGPLYGIDRLNEALYMDDSVDAIVAGGDNIDGHLDSTDGLLNDEQNFALELLFGSRNHADKFALKGNHDDGTLRLRNYRLGIQPSPDYFPTTISSDQFKQHFMTENLLFNEHRNKNSTYFYKDYPDKKVRLIGLDSNDSPEDIKLSDGGVKYIGINNMGYRQDQLDWLANIALQNIPEDYATIVVVHAQATPTGNDDTDLSNGMIGHHTNQAQVNQILNDFKNGQSSVVTNSVKDWEVNVKTNFVTQGKRDLVAWIHGHLHYEEYTTSNGFNDISCIAAIGTNTPDKWDETEGGWTLFTLDRTNRKLITTGYGLATKRTFTY